MALETLLGALSWAGIAVFAVAGALTASRKELDPVGFVLMASLTAFGGGTVRDLLLNRPVFWLDSPATVALTAAVAIAVFFAAPLIERRYVPLLWADAAGMAVFAVLGAETAQAAGASPWAAILLGTVTATFGGILRDVVAGEIPLVLRREIYVSAAALGAAASVGLNQFGADRSVAVAAGVALAFGLRAAALLRGWSLPAYRSRPGRDYPPDRPVPPPGR